MFFTIDHTRLPFPVSDSGVSAWNMVEVALVFPFFMVGFTAEHKGDQSRSTFLIGSFRQLDELIKSQEPGRLRIHFVNLICPQRISGGAPWEMHRVATLFQAQEPEQPDHVCQVYETVEGRKFVDSLIGTSLCDLGELTTLHTFNLKAVSSSKCNGADEI